MSYENRLTLSEQIAAQRAKEAITDANIINILNEAKTELGISDEEFQKLSKQVGEMTDREIENTVRRIIG